MRSSVQLAASTWEKPRAKERRRGTWAAPSAWGCVRWLLRALSSRPHLASPRMKSKEIVCVWSQVSLRLNPNRKKLLASTKLGWRCWYSKRVRMSLSLRQMGRLWGLLSFGNLGSYLHNERFRVFWPGKSYSRAQYLYWVLISKVLISTLLMSIIACS